VEVQEGEDRGRVAVVADSQPPERRQPGDRALDGPPEAAPPLAGLDGAPRDPRGEAPAAQGPPPEQEAPQAAHAAAALPTQVAEAFARLALDEAAQAVGSFVTAANRYAEETAPWRSALAGGEAELRTALYHLAAAARLAAWHYWSFIPRAAEEAHRRLAGRPPGSGGGTFGTFAPGGDVLTGPPLFPRVAAAGEVTLRRPP
jgi:methionyl-tRNA synthetase